MALGLTAFVFALKILHWGHTQTGWLLPLDFVLHGWPLIAVNVAFCCYLCWVGFWFVRGTAGQERFFMMGWFLDILLLPLEKLLPQWAVPIRHVGAFGLAVALLAAVSLLLAPSDVAASKPMQPRP